MPLRYVAIDVETAQPYDHVVEIGAVEIVGGRVGKRTFSRRIRPVSAMSPHCQAVHRITLAELAGEPLFAQVLPDLVEYVGDAPLIAHNATYERNTFRKEFARAGLMPWGDDRYRCTMALAKANGVPAKLREACAHQGILPQGLGKRHAALEDAAMCAGLFLRLDRLARAA